MVCLPYRPEEPELCVYHQTKWRAHYEVAKPIIEDGLLLVIVQLGAVYGPEDKEYGSIRVLVDNSKAKRELGIEHRPLEEGIREYLEWELEQLDREVELTRRGT